MVPLKPVTFRSLMSHVTCGCWLTPRSCMSDVKLTPVASSSPP